ncbi:undecaprenyl-phosphate glucose phosphotransferase [Pseudoduganella namucuonensis]|uniref:Putative colanic acid biosysnthesis UDP-glucose lipid carrier transferase n=1 Tax=Pseudoduganella namucuonensis TaxID=1035707 RepID=A0A1I7K2S9_9BURK|nr:undecaprenyl-phosphate glucose phosphotransferase [Pseudoduganella namucuonensis]SFU91768.1 putative colanic acid biosysnthesis UDP-glucose lipid carrier transferase [Pseudoduganella namucuonensis]
MKTPFINDPARLVLAIRIGDLLGVLLAAQIAIALRYGSMAVELPPIYTILQLFCCGMAFALFPRLGMYSAWHNRPAGMLVLQLCGAWACTLLAAVVFSVLIRHVGELSRLWLAYWFGIGAALLVLARIAARWGVRYARMHGVRGPQVLVVGGAATSAELCRRVRQQEQPDYEVRALCPAPDGHAPARVADLDLLEGVETIPDYVAGKGIDEIWIALPMNQVELVTRLQYLLRNHFVDIRWIMDTQQLQILRGNMELFLGYPSIHLNCPDTGLCDRVGKYLFDKVVSAAALILLSPLFLAICLGVKLSSPGPACFVQRRVGLNGVEFKVFKFRSMRLHQEPGGAVVQASANDPRVTPFGAFLRRTSLDELPQFLNVLLGDMSIVGPRPHAVQHTEMYRDLLDVYMVRHRAKPGITGWAQINGYRGETDTVDKMIKRVQFDLYYIQHWSLWMDVRIVLWTAFKGWTGRNAY